MRIAHASDIHWSLPPRVNRLSPKRLLGAANLYLRGRRKEFSSEVQSALVEAVQREAPDLFIITGDLTALALPEEFRAAREALAPVLDSIPTFVIPGNHDVYTRGSVRSGRMARHFAPWMGEVLPSGLSLLDTGELRVVGLDPNRPGLFASGRLPEAQLDDLEGLLAEHPAELPLLVALHYPVLDPQGIPYDNRGHGLLNASALIERLAAGPVRPAAMLHGHRHRGYRIDLQLKGGAVPIFGVGAGGMVRDVSRNRAAALNIYALRDGGIAELRRLQHDGRRFVEEPGGPYSTGM